MSAFMCSKEHVGYIIAAYWRFAESYDLVPGKSPAQIGQLMLAENLKSMEHRYGDGLGVEELGRYMADVASFEYRDYEAVKPVAVNALKLISSWRYQSCEHPGHETSDAWALARHIEKLCINALPGYEEAEWSL